MVGSHTFYQSDHNLPRSFLQEKERLLLNCTQYQWAVTCSQKMPYLPTTCLAWSWAPDPLSKCTAVPPCSLQTVHKATSYPPTWMSCRRKIKVSLPGGRPFGHGPQGLGPNQWVFQILWIKLKCDHRKKCYYTRFWNLSYSHETSTKIWVENLDYQ